jgi:catechol 2,3-dioxygenase-like lactoylglutathione lyase family enzyme
MNWRVRSDDGDKIVMDIGEDVGTVIIRGGYEAPPAPPAPPPPPAGAEGGRGRGRGNFAPAHVVWDSFAWGISPWDKNKVEAELRKRHLNPVWESDGKGFEAFSVTDPGGFTLKLTDGSKHGRHRGTAKGTLPAAAPFEPTNWRTVWLDHISFACPNYKESVAFYQALLGWRPLRDEGSQNETEIADLGNIIIRGGGGPAGGRGGRAGAGGDSTGGRGGAPPTARKALINHIAFGIAPWEPDAVAKELTKRGLSASPDTGGRGDIHTAPYQSYHTRTPDGFDLQISNATLARRVVR